MKYIALILFICLVSCKAQKETKLPSGEKMEDLVLVAQDNYSGVLEYQAQVIRDVKSLNKFYSQVNKTRKPGLPVPVVDFSKETVLLICLGEQKGERLPLLSKNEESEDFMMIAVELSDVENKSDNGNLPISHPFYLYKIPNTSKNIEFEKRSW